MVIWDFTRKLLKIKLVIMSLKFDLKGNEEALTLEYLKKLEEEEKRREEEDEMLAKLMQKEELGRSNS